ncbi:hypothetical protein [Nocardia thraciensis]
MLVPAAAMLMRDPQAAPTCDEKPMTPGTTCRYYRNGESAGGKSYEQALAEQRGSHETGTQLLLSAAGVIIVSSAVLVGVRYARSSGAPKSAAATPTNPVDQDPRQRELLRAATGGDPVAMNNLARLLQDQVARQSRLERWRRRYRNGGDLAEAELWFRRAAVAGHPDAMASLAALLNQDGNRDEAELWYRRATAAEGVPYTPHTVAGTGAPVPPPTPTPAGEFKTLLGMVMGSHATAERLIAFEQRKLPDAGRAAAITKAIERLQADRRR